uniref:ABC transporter ATP-binding protein/permease wht-1-like isoform X1 n=1 Tax=Ciona intestinalis TaxID=7719 RepID=UPI000180C5FC|nr:ABC transporter ATP-binding protein/permease wht-1-like isoform X1 [Ciona intestinalis]|eukprot:XP_009860097.1 ABC transporter ATP-binding protein/permease wht-1-like isoform X1 [Ciona intestinalis]
MADNVAYNCTEGEPVLTRNRRGANIETTITNADGIHAPTSRPLPSLSWNNINVKVPQATRCFGRIKKPEKIILNNVSGYAEPGRLLAIIGSSGAGKSTLLNMLTWRNKSQLYMTGDILVNGVSMGADISSISAYVEQDDLFMGELTVKEHLMFAARLQMSPDVSDETKSRRVHEIMKQLSLKRCENTTIGTPGTKTLSGGEKKRLSLATKLLTNPSIMFFDEPTSGLDSYLARMIVDSMKTVAKSGCTVICTIHQPSSEVFEMFDDLMILAMGRVVYHGEIPGALQHYADNGFPCPRNYNPSDHFIMEIAIVPGEEKQSKARTIKLIESFEQKNSPKKHSTENGESILTTIKSSGSKSPYKVGFVSQFNACFIRAIKTTYRNDVVKARSVINILQPILIALVFFRQYGKHYVSSEVSDIIGLIFITTLSLSLNFVFGVLYSFPLEIHVFKREYFSGMYGAAPYFLSKNLAELPTYIIIPFIYATLLYFISGLFPGWQQYINFCLVMILLTNTGISFSYLIACATPSLNLAIAVAPLTIIPLVVFGGFLTNNGNLPVFLDWIKYLSWFFYANELLNINQWENVGFLGCPQFAPPNATIVDTRPGPCLFANGQSVIRSLNFNVDNYYRDIGLMFTLLVAFRVFAFGFMLRRVRESER